MKKRMLAMVMALCLALSLLPVSAGADDEVSTVEPAASNAEWGADYNEETSFTISTEAELRAFAVMVNDGKDFSGKTVTLQNDITLSNEAWVPIGSAANYSTPELRVAFNGTFDGAGKTISGLFMKYDNGPIYNCGGLFGCVTGAVKNVILENVNLTFAYADFGSLVGYLGEG